MKRIYFTSSCPMDDKLIESIINIAMRYGIDLKERVIYQATETCGNQTAYVDCRETELSDIKLIADELELSLFDGIPRIENGAWANEYKD